MDLIQPLQVRIQFWKDCNHHMNYWVEKKFIEINECLFLCQNTKESFGVVGVFSWNLGIHLNIVSVDIPLLLAHKFLLDIQTGQWINAPQVRTSRLSISCTLESACQGPVLQPKVPCLWWLWSSEYFDRKFVWNKVWFSLMQNFGCFWKSVTGSLALLGKQDNSALLYTSYRVLFSTATTAFQAPIGQAQNGNQAFP